MYIDKAILYTLYFLVLASALGAFGNIIWGSLVNAALFSAFFYTLLVVVRKYIISQQDKIS